MKNVNCAKNAKLPGGRTDDPKDYHNNCNSNSFNFKIKDSCTQNNQFLQNCEHVKTNKEIKEENHTKHHNK